MSNIPLIEKYRPKTFDEVIANNANIKSIKDGLASESRPHVFLFTGAPGTGKTTLAEIIATEVNCASDQSILRLNASISGGVDDSRNNVEKMTSFPLDGGESKVMIIDECHELSAKAWSPFLTIIERPPSHAYFIFCTSEEQKVNKAIYTRCAAYTLNLAKDDELFDYLMEICLKEEIAPPEGVLEIIVNESNGSTRQALSYLSVLREVETLEAASVLLQSTKEQDTNSGLAYSFAQFLCICDPNQYPTGMKLVQEMMTAEKNNWGDYKPTMLNYVNKVLTGANRDRFMQLIPVLDAINEYPPYHKDLLSLKTELLLLLGRYMIAIT